MIGWPLSFIALFFVFRLLFTQTGEFDLSILTVNYVYLFLGILCFVIYFFFRCNSWLKILNLQGHFPSYKRASYYWGISELKRYVPGNVWSYVGRSVLFSRLGLTKKDLFVAFILEAETLVISSLILSLFAVSFTTKTLLPMPYLELFLYGGIVVSTGGFIFQKEIFDRLFKKIPLVHHIISPFSWKDHVGLIGWNVISFVFFALGYFFSVSATISLPLSQIVPLSSFFIMAYIAGYLSFLTPSGLGVREGTITLGLIPFATLQLAGYAALFSRVILILSELIFTAIVYGLHKAVDQKTEK